MAEPRKLGRREFIEAASLGAIGLITLTNRSLKSLLSGKVFSEALAQDSIKNLKPFSLRKLKELDSVMDKKFKREFWETKDGCFVSAKADGTNNEHEVYLEITGGTFSTTLKKGIDFRFPKDRKNPNAEQKYDSEDLQRLCDYYREACAASGCDRKERIWLKLIFNVHQNGANVIAIFVDEKPRPNDSSDLKPGYPVLGLIFAKNKNGLTGNRLYYRIEND